MPHPSWPGCASASVNRRMKRDGLGLRHRSAAGVSAWAEFLVPRLSRFVVEFEAISQDPSDGGVSLPRIMRQESMSNPSLRSWLILLSLVPHLYVTAIGLGSTGPSGFLLGLLAWSLAPVAIGAALAHSRWRAQGIGWLVATLASSLWAVWVGVLRPKGSTASLIFLFIPMWNIALIGPAGMLLATLWVRIRRRPPASA
jgi:hypothetical protein